MTAEQILEKYWGHQSFRPLQKEIINSIVNGGDTIALLPTGGGKSICYQVPALMQNGLCLVISPLLSLMTDQVEQLLARDIKAVAINSFMSRNQIDHALDNTIFGNYKLLYISPERLQTEIFKERFKKMPISFIAVDEAHCISQWGYDFRPSYLEINTLRELRPELPILALTATATSEVVDDIGRHLSLRNAAVFKQSYARKNLAFSVVKAENKNERILKALKGTSGSSIVYVRNRKKTVEIAEYLNQNGICASFYHAGIKKEDRQTRQKIWSEHPAMCMVSTNAFGMGIDKADVRTVIHYDLPESIEAFYQEAGRAGRDGLPSNAITLYSNSDRLRLIKNHDSSFPPETSLQHIYDKLCNHFQIALNEGLDMTFLIDVSEFVGKYQLNNSLAKNALKQLHHEGFISLSEGILQPSTIQICMDRSTLFEVERPQVQNELINYLLRAYSGILEQDCQIDEKLIGRQLDISPEELSRHLEYLSRTNVIIYKASSSLPAITFLKNRVSADQLLIGQGYKKRKEVNKSRIDSVVSFMENSALCRMVFILDYFGEEGSEACGTCDVCTGILAEPNEKQRNELMREIVSILKTKGSLSVSEIHASLSGYQERHVIQSCRTLLDKGILISDGLILDLVDKTKF